MVGKAIYDYAAREPGEINLLVNDEIEITYHPDDVGFIL
jgi:hypothetical protein